MKKTLSLILFIIITFTSFACTEALAKKSKKQAGIDPKQFEQLQEDVQYLTKKIYASSLFAPSDNEKMIEIKLLLDKAMLSSPDPTFAPMYYKAGIIYAAREFKDEAEECFQAILENFGDTALAPKARKELGKMGIEVKAPVETDEEEEE